MVPEIGTRDPERETVAAVLIEIQIFEDLGLPLVTRGLRHVIRRRLIGLPGANLVGSSRDVLFVSGGAAAGQILAIVAVPLIVRIYNPSHFGIFAICSAIIVTLGTIGTLRFELAVCLPESETEAQGLATLGIAAAVVVNVSIAIILLTAGTRIVALIGHPTIMPWLWLVPGSALAMSCFLVLNQLALRHARFSKIGLRNILQQGSTVVAQVALGAAAIRPGGLIVGLGLGQLVGAISLLPGSGLLGSDARAGRRRPVLVALMRRYNRFPLVLGPSALLNVLGLQFPLLLVAFWFGSAPAGWLGLTQKVLALPIALIGTAVGQVYFARLAIALRTDPKRAVSLFRRASFHLACASFTLMIAILTLGPWAFSVILGESWTTSGEYARALAAPFAVQMIAAPLSMTLIALERQRTQLFWDFGRLVVVFASVAVARYLGATALETIWALGLALTITYISSWVICFLTLRRHIGSQSGLREQAPVAG